MAVPARASSLFVASSSDTSKTMPVRPPPGLAECVPPPPCPPLGVGLAEPVRLPLPALLFSKPATAAPGMAKKSQVNATLPPWYRPPPGLSLPGEEQKATPTTPGGDRQCDSDCSTTDLSDSETVSASVEDSPWSPEVAGQFESMPLKVPIPAPPPPPRLVVELSTQLAEDSRSESRVSVGSFYHHLGLCRPCDFINRDGCCRSGVACKFCHLCGPDEHKAKRKFRKKVVKAQRKMEKAGV